ncbi:hypothetical protein GCM10027037_15180 [Mucilaginibacter koreensis]
MKDFYAILGVNTDSNSDELRIAYEKLSDKFNPELNAQDQFFANRYNEILEAYGVLSDPLKRRKYDATFVNLKQASASERRKIKRYYSTTKGVNSVLTMVLIVLAFVFGYFVYKAINSHKTIEVNRQLLATVNETPIHAVKHHKRKEHTAKWKTWSVSSPVKKATPVIAVEKSRYKATPVQTVPAISKATSVAQPAPATVDAPKSIQQQPARVADAINSPVLATAKPNNQPEYLYTTYIKSNETGVIKMRETASYNAETMATIPSNSKVTVLERGGLYYKIKFEDRIGYVPKWTIQDK